MRKIEFSINDILVFAIDYRNGMLGLVDEMGKPDWDVDSEEVAKKKADTFFRYLLCQSLGDFMIFSGYLIYKLEAGFIRKDASVDEHLWIVLGDEKRAILDPMAAYCNEAFRKMPEVYVGAKPDWYEDA